MFPENTNHETQSPDNSYDDILTRLMRDDPEFANMLKLTSPEQQASPPAPEYTPVFEPKALEEITQEAFPENRQPFSPAPYRFGQAPDTQEDLKQPAYPETDQFEQIPDAQEEPERPVMTDKQLRFVSRLHLLMMIRDLEKELMQAKEENKKLLTAYKAGLNQKQPD